MVSVCVCCVCVEFFCDSLQRTECEVMRTTPLPPPIPRRTTKLYMRVRRVGVDTVSNTRRGRPRPHRGVSKAVVSFRVSSCGCHSALLNVCTTTRVHCRRSTFGVTCWLADATLQQRAAQTPFFSSRVKGEGWPTVLDFPAPHEEINLPPVVYPQASKPKLVGSHSRTLSADETPVRQKMFRFGARCGVM